MGVRALISEGLGTEQPEEYQITEKRQRPVESHVARRVSSSKEGAELPDMCQGRAKRVMSD